LKAGLDDDDARRLLVEQSAEFGSRGVDGRELNFARAWS
jgi:hypothetical protein